MLLSAALCGCSALDRLENIGEAPKLSPVGNPADTQIVAPFRRCRRSAMRAIPCGSPAPTASFTIPAPTTSATSSPSNVSVADTAKLPNTTSRSRTNSDDANLTNFFGLENALPKSIDPSSVVKMGSDMSNVGSGSVNRRKPST